MRLGELAERVGCTLHGDPGLEIRAVRGIEEAGPGDLTFLANLRYVDQLPRCRASAIILPADGPPCPLPTLRTPHPYLAFGRAMQLFHPLAPPPTGIHPTAVLGNGVRLGQGVSVGALAVVADGVEVGEETWIGAQVYIGPGSRIGRRCVLHPRVTLREAVLVGDRVIIQSGAVVGSDGFGYARDELGRYVKIPQVGRVVLEDDVELGANVAVDRATMGETRVRRGTKLDNLVQVAHNVVIGEDTVIVAQVGISGSTTIGSRVTLAGQAGIVGHLRIGDDVTIGAQAGVTKDLPDGAVVLGSPAMPHMEYKRSVAAARRIPELRKLLRGLEERVRALEARQ